MMAKLEFRPKIVAVISKVTNKTKFLEENHRLLLDPMEAFSAQKLALDK